MSATAADVAAPLLFGSTYKEIYYTELNTSTSI